jgi:hypothetical protein
MRFRRAVIAVLLAFVATVVLVEGGLRLFDPWGAWRYFGDLRAVFAAYSEPSREYAIAPGIYTFSNWEAVILPDGTRRVPDTAQTDCTIALVGDSVTFGLGVSDADTWANVAARELPAVHIVNAGVPAASIGTVAAEIRRTPADGYVYLMIDNDDAPEGDVRRWGIPDGAIRTYLYMLQEFRPAQYTPDPGARAQITAVAEREDTQAVAFAGNPMARDVPDVTYIPMYTKRISRVDAHADAEGNAQIAASILPIVRKLAATRCQIM